jgi:site-specific DNA-cytosine methylase
VRVLVACEFSGRVRDAFAAHGHFAVSCDIVRSESKRGYHYQGDVRDILHDGWDLMVAHPPCTYLAVAGAQYFRVPERIQRRREAIEFVRTLMNAPIYYIAIENPVGLISRYIRRPDQMIHPWQFGDTEEKKTHLWLKNLPLLRPTKFVPFRHHTRWLDNVDSGPNRGKVRSVTFPGIAQAMADQWGTLQGVY